MVAPAPEAEASATKSPPQPTSTHLPDGRLVYDVAPEYLTGFFTAEQTTAEANRNVSIWLGRLMRVSAPVHNVREYGASTTLVFRPAMHVLTFARITEPTGVARANVLRRGHHVTLVGRIEKVESDNVELVDCELADS